IDEKAIKEAMTTADFTTLTTNILSWKLAMAYNSYPLIQGPYARKGKVQDFRTQRSTILDGLDQPFAVVPEFGEYQEGPLSERGYGYKVQKFGKGFGLSFEAKVNDFLGVFDDTPNALARGARNTETMRTTQLYMAAGGPVTSYVDYAGATRSVFSTANLNFGHGILNFANLSTAITQMMSQISESGEPIVNMPKYLEVPPNLYLLAKQLISPGNLFAATVGRTDAAAGAATVGVNTNYLAEQGIQVIMNPFLPVVGSTVIGSGPNTGSTYGQTSWFLWGDPQFGNALEVGYLAGHETPELWMRKPNAIIVGGGEVPPEDGSFENDAMFWRCRMFFGGTILNPKFVYSSDGTV
ncbi:MAG: Mu-like prophage major head subunit gpT family protein, partial [Thermomicrobia bacterium]|nr:Mu-like prophage major head subunit gpT family protein [Thermomicrobia bacterium]